MLRTIIDKEVRDLFGSTKFAITFGVCALLIVLTFYIGAANYRVSMAHYEAAKAESMRQMEGLTDWLSVEQHRVMLPPRPLTALVAGVSNDIGRTTEVRASGELKAHDSRYNEDPLYAVFRFLDLGFVFQIVLSLFAILLGYDAISGEKERGTLKLALSNAVPRSTYLLGKLIGSFAALAVSLLAAIAAGCLMLPILGVNMPAADWTRLGLIVLCGLLYFGVFLAASMFVSSITQRSSSSFLMLLVIWIGAVLIVPRVSVLLAGRAVNVPSVDELAAQKATFRGDLWSTFRDQMVGFKSSSKGDPDATMREFQQFTDSITTIRESKMNEYVQRLNEDRYNRQRAQQRLSFALARVSPMTSLTLATSELAGSSLKLKDQFRKSASDYQTTFADFIEEKTGVNPRQGMLRMQVIVDGEEKPDPIDPAELPAFTINQPELAESVEAAVPDIGLLALFGMTCFVGAFVAFQRYDVR